MIDAGVNAVPDEERAGRLRLAGDVAFDAVCGVAGAVTPVPGGVGRGRAGGAARERGACVGAGCRATITPTAQLPLFHY